MIHSLDQLKRSYIENSGDLKFFKSEIISNTFNKLVHKSNFIFFVTRTDFSYLSKGSFYTVWRYDLNNHKIKNHSEFAEYNNLKQVVKVMNDL